MSITLKLDDFFAEIFSMSFWRKRWLNIRALIPKNVDATTLEELCGYINPSYSDLVDRFQEATGQGGLLHVGELVHAFYNDREEFLSRLKDILIPLGSAEWANSLYEEFRSICAPIPDKFKEIVNQKGLEAHIRLSEHISIGSVIDVVNIKLKGEANLTFGGGFGLWLFRHVKFCDDVFINIYPSFLAERPKVDFYQNIFYGDFTCRFSSVDYISIANNKFKHSVLIGADINSVENKDIVSQWKKDMEHHEAMDSPPSATTVMFSNNHCEELITLYNHLNGHDLPRIKQNLSGISMVRFENGNTIGGLSIPQSKLANIALEYYLRWKFGLRGKIFPHARELRLYQHLKSATGIGSFHFDINEHIKMPDKTEAPLYKDFFIRLKQKAIRAHDREAAFNYGRKERYFDRGAAPRRQDRFILWWSHLVSDGGISWFRPAAILLVGQYALAAIFIGWLGGCCDYAAWFQAAVESLNPLSSLPDMLKSLGDGNESCKKSLSRLGKFYLRVHL